MRGWKKIFHANGNQKKAGVAILISDKIEFKIKIITRDKEGHYIMIKGSIQEEDITIVNIYAHSIGTPQYIRKMLTAIKPDRQNARTNGKSKAIQTESHTAAYTYTLTKRENGKIYIYCCSQSPPPQFLDDSLSIQVFQKCRVHQVDFGDLICWSRGC